MTFSVWLSEKIDRFPAPIELKFNKKSSLATFPGVLITLVLLVITIIYGIQKF
jgi:hypothetical protein